MRDPREEQWLSREGVDWYPVKDVPLSQVDWEASLKNQARLKVSLIPEHVDELSMAVLDGAQLPDPVGYYSKDGRIIIISGNHRVAAYRQINELKLGNIEKIDWYIVNSYHWKLDILTRTSNRIEGLPLTKEERVEQAKHFVRVLNFSAVDAGKALGISSKTVNLALEGDDVRERLAKYQFQGNIPLTTLCKLYRIKQDNALLETANLVQEAQLSGEEAAEVAAMVEKAARSEKQQQHVLAELRKDYKDRIARTKKGQLKRQIAPSIKFRRAVNWINSTRPEAVVPLEPELMRRAKFAIKKLEEVIKSGVTS